MKIRLMTAFPPSRGLLKEYGHHIAQELTKHPLLNVTILVDQIDQLATTRATILGAAAPGGASWM